MYCANDRQRYSCCLALRQVFFHHGQRNPLAVFVFGHALNGIAHALGR